MLDEVSRDFNVPVKLLLAKLSEISYVPPLSPLEYVDRIIDDFNYMTFRISQKNWQITIILSAASPAVRACGAIVRCCQDGGVELKINRLAA